MNTLFSKIVTCALTILLVGTFFQIPVTSHAASNFAKSKIYYNTSNAVTDIEFSWVDGNSEALLVLHCENPYDEWDSQVWIIGQFYAKGGNESIDLRQSSAERDKLYLAITGQLKGLGKENGGYADFSTQADMDGTSYDTDFKFEVVPPIPGSAPGEKGGMISLKDAPSIMRSSRVESRIGYFRRTDGNTLKKVEKNYTESKTRLEGSGSAKYALADSNNTEIHFGTDDSNLRINGYERTYTNRNLTVIINKLKLLENRSATGEVLPVACKDASNKIVCAKSEDDCTKSLKGSVVNNCSTLNPPKVCRPDSGCVDVSAVDPTTKTTTPSTTTTATVNQGTKAVVPKSINILNPLQFNSPQELAVGIINFILGLAGLAALGVIIVGGYQYITSAGEEQETQKAKRTITYAVAGLLVIILSFIIVRSVTNIIGGGTSTGSPTTTPTPTATTTAPKSLPVPGQSTTPTPTITP